MRIITRKKKNSTRKWNRTHFFQNEKKPENTKGVFKEHPAYIFAQSGELYRAIIFTRHPPEDKDVYLPLKHNIQEGKVDKSYGMRYRGPRHMSEFQPPKEKYRIHNDDLKTVKQLKSPYKKKK